MRAAASIMPSPCPLEALRGTSGGATMTTPVRRAQHHAPVCSKATRARRTGFYHGAGALTLLGSGPSLCPTPSA
jgi:hypothetical protein